MTKVGRVDAARKRREIGGYGARARRRLSSAVDARRRLNAPQADEANSLPTQADGGDSRYAYLRDSHD
jgi:hypothetical protein